MGRRKYCTLLPASAYSEAVPPLGGALQEVIMGKIRKGNKETKKQALLTPKEKKVAKQVKKHAGDKVPFVVH
ncbi:MAG TPA: hypothetical protein PKL28_14695 [Rhodocyclaceae bacterium]|jgi:hypothetical protein|nr:hypothetical protein [Rhodocyclaceae bacterium]HNM20960.1 hypothetical protein [Rhodocyclaceae bacterium]HNM82301.1 hypothetical protein [Rhodocyclaceae bacterium]